MSGGAFTCVPAPNGATRLLAALAARDAADEIVLEAAVNGQAQAIVAFNHRDYGNAPPRFGVLLLLPAEAYRRIEA